MTVRHCRAVVAVACASLTLSCQSGVPREPESVALKVSESAVFAEFSLAFIDVESDSRCPTPVQCIWAGNAVVAVTAAHDNLPTSITAAKKFLNTNLEPRSLPVNGAIVVLDSLTPARVTTDSIPQSNYTAYFTILR